MTKAFTWQLLNNNLCLKIVKAMLPKFKGTNLRKWNTLLRLNFYLTPSLHNNQTNWGLINLTKNNDIYLIIFSSLIRNTQNYVK